MATLNTSAFLLLSLLLSAHSLLHGTLILLWSSDALSILQVPVHPFLLLVCFNAFSSVNPWLRSAADYWGAALTFSGPLFISMEGLSSLLVVQKLGQEGKRLVGEGEIYQFALLIASAVAYVLSAWWIVVVRRVYLLLLAWFTLRSTVLPCRGVVPSLVHPFGCCHHCLPFPYFHRLCLETDKHNRILGTSRLHCIQRLALRFRPDAIYRRCIILVRSLFLVALEHLTYL